MKLFKKIRNWFGKQMLKGVINDIKDDLPEIKTEVTELVKVNGSELLGEIKKTIVEFIKSKIKRQRDTISDK